MSLLCDSATSSALRAPISFCVNFCTVLQVFVVTLAISVASWLGVYAALLPLTPHVHMLSGMTPQHQQMVCSLCATLMVARSPASAIAVLQETAGRGPFSSLALTVVIVKDVLTIVAFAVNIEVARALFAPGALHLSVAELAQPLVSVLAAVAIGAAAAAGFAALFSSPLPGPRHMAFNACTAAVVALAALTFQAASFFDAEPLLACTVAGLLASNSLCAPPTALTGLHRQDCTAAQGHALTTQVCACRSIPASQLRTGDTPRTGTACYAHSGTACYAHSTMSPLGSMHSNRVATSSRWCHITGYFCMLPRGAAGGMAARRTSTRSSAPRCHA